jgi:hypothetical protein
MAVYAGSLGELGGLHAGSLCEPAAIHVDLIGVELIGSN